MRISSDGGTPAALTALDTGKGQRTHRWPSALQGGRVVLYTVGQADRPDNALYSSIEAVTIATGERRVVMGQATMARYVETGHLVFMRAGTLHAIPFDADRLVTTGDAVPMIDEVMEAGSGAAHLTIAQDGTLAYILGTSFRAPRRIAWLSADGTAQPLELEPAQYGDLRISPDGTRIAFSQHRNGLWIYDIPRKSVTRLTSVSGDLTPTWSADSKFVYYVGRTPKSTTIFRKPADGSREAEPMASLAGTAYLGEIIAGGTAALMNLVVRSDRTDLHSDIARVSLAVGQSGTTVPVNLEATPASESAVDVSPNERWMAYQSNENGSRSEVYVRDMSGNRARWQVSIAGGEEPYWSPDGSRLYYRFDDALYAVTVDTRAGFITSAPQFIYRGVYNTGNDGPSYTVDPKSGRVLMLRPTAGNQGRHTIRVVLNWFEDLVAKSPAR